MANMQTALTPETTPVYIFDQPPFPTYSPPFDKNFFINRMVNPVITRCPRLAILWREILQEPLRLGYIPWDSMIRLMSSLHKHNNIPHPCIPNKEVNLFIIRCLFLCRVIHYPPYPAGAEDDKPFFAATRVRIPDAFNYFEKHIFRKLDLWKGDRMFDSIREEPGLMTREEVNWFGTRVYLSLEEQGILPPALVDRNYGVPPGI
jgi:hypothetical protein